MQNCWLLVCFFSYFVCLSLNLRVVVWQTGRIRSGHGATQVWVETSSGQLKKGCFGSGQNGFGPERVSGRVG
ncbi:hypothetical protein Hanom_Chr17g01560301 [Helianthus anomalus]